MTSTYVLLKKDFRDHSIDRYIGFFDEPIDIDFEDMTDEQRLEYFRLKKALKKVGSAVKTAAKTVGDVAQGVAKLTVAPINAVTGHEYDFNTSSKIGQAFEWAGDAAEDAQTNLYGLQTPTETKFGAAIGKIGGAVVQYIPIASELHQLATPILQKVNAKELGLLDARANEGPYDPAYGPSEETIEDKIRANIVPIAGGAAVLMALIIVLYYTSISMTGQGR